jgi:hypothetical protein
MAQLSTCCYTSEDQHRYGSCGFSVIFVHIRKNDHMLLHLNQITIHNHHAIKCINRHKLVQFDSASRCVSNGCSITRMHFIMASSTLPGSPSHTATCDGTTAQRRLLPYVCISPRNGSSISRPVVGCFSPGGCSGSWLLGCTSLPPGNNV